MWGMCGSQIWYRPRGSSRTTKSDNLHHRARASVDNWRSTLWYHGQSFPPEPTSASRFVDNCTSPCRAVSRIHGLCHAATNLRSTLLHLLILCFSSYVFLLWVVRRIMIVTMTSEVTIILTTVVFVLQVTLRENTTSGSPTTHECELYRWGEVRIRHVGSHF